MLPFQCAENCFLTVNFVMNSALSVHYVIADLYYKMEHAEIGPVLWIIVWFVMTGTQSVLVVILEHIWIVPQGPAKVKNFGR